MNGNVEWIREQKLTCMNIWLAALVFTYCVTKNPKQKLNILKITVFANKNTLQAVFT